MIVLDLSDIVAGDNDRTVFDDDELGRLAASIDAVGQIEPVVVEPIGSASPPRYRLVCGERRFRAHLLLGRSTINAVVEQLTAEQAAARMLAENTARVNLSLMDEARAYRKRADAGLSVDEIATLAGVEPFRVRWRLALMDLDAGVQASIEQGLIPAGAANEIARLDRSLHVQAARAWLRNPNRSVAAFARLCDSIAKAEPEQATLTLGEWSPPPKPPTRAELIDALRRLVPHAPDELQADTLALLARV